MRTDTSIALLFAIVAILSLPGIQCALIKETCNPNTNCKLPDCRCADVQNPLFPTPSSKIPQIVYLTFDDSVTVTNIGLYEEIFSDTRRNPNGARISGTFFVSHEYNNYSLVNRLYREGHEIALHSLTHNADISYWRNLPEDGKKSEFLDQVPQLANFAQIPESNLTDFLGMRSPFLVGFNSQYDGIYDPDPSTRKIWYDSSKLPSWSLLQPYAFPYTADYELEGCSIEPCPQKRYPGFWVSNMGNLIDAANSPCTFADTCIVPDNADEVFEWFVKNFNNRYHDRRDPFGIYTHATWLMANEHIKEAYLRFIDHILNLPGKDVYIVSIKKGLQWQRYPATTSQIDDGSAPSQLLDAWKDTPVVDDNCPVKTNCFYDESKTPPGMGERFMGVCGACPPYYPWLDNPLGENPYFD